MAAKSEPSAAGDWWVVDVTKELAAADKKVEQCHGHSINRVPASIRELNADTARSYQPQVVSLGPFHHGDKGLLPMEEHKRRAMLRLVTRAGKTPEQLVAALWDVAEELEGAYQDLGDEWRGGEEKRKKFLRMMVLDGCFLLEMMRIAVADAGGEVAKYGYRKDDPIFSQHGVLYTVPYVRRDMLVIENQLPLLVLLKLEEVLLVRRKDPVDNDYINKMVLMFMSPEKPSPSVAVRDSSPLGLHPLDVFRKSLLYTPDHKRCDQRPPQKNDESHGIIRSAVELYDAGIRFRKSSSDSLSDVRFRCGVLSLPHIVVDDSTEYMFLNVMAFERLHVGTGSDITSYVFLMDNIIDSAKDVALLTSKGIIQNAVGSDEAVAKLFNGLSRDVVLDPNSVLDELHREVNAYCRKRWNRWRANLVHTYFHSPWSFLSLAAAVFLLALTVTQTVYAVMQFYQGGNGNGSSSPPSPPAPR